MTSLFRKFDHVERYGNSEVEGIDIGEVYVFPKLDGTNASVWLSELGVGCAGSRNRVLSAEKDNHNFFKMAQSSPTFDSLLHKFMHHNIYGEWLVPHTLRTYRYDAWRRFYIFDIWDMQTRGYLHYTEYAPWCLSKNIPVIEPLCIINNPTEDQLRAQVQANTYLIADGRGIGEGIVLKNYSWTNKYGRQPWAKIVNNEFKESNQREFGTTVKEGAVQPEIVIAQSCITRALVDKELAKIVWSYSKLIGRHVRSEYLTILENNRKTIIPRLLETIFHCVVTEELWSAVKKLKFPTVNFRRLRACCITETKKNAPELF
jgi:hypothetical protein